MKNIIKDNSGLASLVAVIIISIVTLSIALSIALSGMTEVQSSLFTSKSNKALQLADSCAEEAYFRLKLDSTYSGGNLNLGSDSCGISISGTGNTRTITTSATVDRFTRFVNADVNFVTNNSGNSKATDLTQWQ